MPRAPRYLILADDDFGPETSKTANACIRYTPDHVVGVIDKSQAGRTVGEVLGFGDDIPVVATLDEGLRLKRTVDELRQALSLPGCPWNYLRFIKGKAGKWTPAAGTFYGWPKMTAWLQAQGYAINYKRVQRLMQPAGYDCWAHVTRRAGLRD